MAECNPANERLKRAYVRDLREADGRAESTIRGIEKALLRWEAFTGFTDFSAFTTAQATAFKKDLSSSLSQSTVLATVNALKRFFKWLACQPGYKTKIRITDINYLNLSENEVRAARAPRYRPYPSVEQIKHAVMAMPKETDVDRRNRALIAFTLLTGMRDSAIASLRLKHVDLENRLVIQDPREVRTKFRKRIDTYIVPVDEELEAIVFEWITYLRSVRLFGEDDPLFPKTAVGHDDNTNFECQGIERAFWSNASPIRDVFKKAFANAGLDYFSPHTFRHTLVHYCQRHCRNPEMLKAFSQNFGHEEVMMTLSSYGRVPIARQGEIVRSLRPMRADDEGSKLEQIKRVLEG